MIIFAKLYLHGKRVVNTVLWYVREQCDFKIWFCESDNDWHVILKMQRTKNLK